MTTINDEQEFRDLFTMLFDNRNGTFTIPMLSTGKDDDGKPLNPTLSNQGELDKWLKRIMDWVRIGMWANNVVDWRDNQWFFEFICKGLFHDGENFRIPYFQRNVDERFFSDLFYHPRWQDWLEKIDFNKNKIRA